MRFGKRLTYTFSGSLPEHTPSPFLDYRIPGPISTDFRLVI